MTPKGLSGRDGAGPVLSLVQSTRLGRGVERAPSSPAPADTRAEVEVHSKPSGSKFAPCFSAGGWGVGIWQLALFGKGPAALGEIPHIALL